MSGERVTIELSRDGWTSGLQLSINAYDETGTGHGYRIFGPKFNGSSERIRTVELSERDIRELKSYLALTDTRLDTAPEPGAS